MQQKPRTVVRKQEAERASRYKSEFLANMSHELRTPLNSTLILAKLLAENKTGRLTDEQVRYAETIYSSGNSLLTLINDILDLSKIESGAVEVRPEETALTAVIDGLFRTFQPIANDKRLEFTREIQPGTPATVITDGQRLHQVLANPLSNAFSSLRAALAGCVSRRPVRTPSRSKFETPASAFLANNRTRSSRHFVRPTAARIA